MNNFLTSLAVLLVLVLSVLFFGPLLVNWDDYRRDVEGRLADILGTKVELDGSLNVRLLPTPYVRAENLRVGESGAAGAPVLAVKELTLWVAVPPLFKGVVEASRVTLQQPKLVLQFDASGRPSFRSSAAQTHNKQDQTLPGSPALSGFALSPNLISLKDVRVMDGEIVLQARALKRKNNQKNRQAKSSPPQQAGALYQLPIRGIEGNFSAKTLKGPFQFQGQVKRDNGVHLVRLAVGAEAQGAHVLKSHVTLPKGETLSFDGKIVEENKRLQVVGALKGDLTPAGIKRQRSALQQNVSQGPAVLRGAAAEGDEVFELWQDNQRAQAQPVMGDEIILTSSVRVGAHEVAFADFLLRSGRLAKPITVKGALAMNWRRELTLKGTFVGQSVDFDHLLKQTFSDPKAAVGPGAALIAFAEGIQGPLQGFDKVELKARANQVTLGKGDVRDVHCILSGDGARLKLERLEGRVPGSGRVSIDGVFATAKTEPQFKGQIYLRGLQFEDMAAWAWPGLDVGRGVFKGKYMLTAEGALRHGRVVVDDFSANLSGLAFKGEIQHPFVASPEQGSSRLVLRAGAVDLGQLFGRPVPLQDYKDALSQLLPLFRQKTNNVPPVDVRLFVNQLTFADAVQRDVSLRWQGTRQGGRLAGFSMTGAEGWRLSYEGGVGGRQTADQFVVEASQLAALRELVRFSQAEAGDRLQLSDAFLTRMLPLRLAVRRETYEGGEQYRVDGQLAGSDAAFSVLIPDQSRADPIQILGGFEGADGPALARLFLPDEMTVQSRGAVGGDVAVLSLPSSGVPLEARRKAVVSVAARGSLDKGFKGQLDFKQNDLSLVYEGGIGFNGQHLASEGVLRMKAKKTADVLQLFGLEGLALASSQQGPAEGKMTFVRTENGYAISDLKGRFGDELVKGTGLLEAVEGEEKLKLALSTSNLSLDLFLASLTQGERGQDEGTQASVWSAKPFLNRANGDGLGRVGTFSLALHELTLSDQLSLRDARIFWRHEAGLLEVTKIEGRLLGGRFTASGSFREVAKGRTFTGSVALKGARLEEIGAQSEMNVGEGAFDLSLRLNGTGVSAADLVGRLFGEGDVVIKKGALRQISPRRLRKIALGFLQAPSGGVTGLKDKVAAAISAAPVLPVKNVTFDVQMVDGGLKLKGRDLGVRPGQLGFEGKLDLSSLNWQGLWSIDARGRGLEGVPEVRQTLAGGLLADQEVRVELDVEEFVSHLDLKQKEKEVRTLENAKILREQERAAEEKLQEALAKQKAQSKVIKPAPQNSVIDWSELPDLVP